MGTYHNFTTSLIDEKDITEVNELFKKVLKDYNCEIHFKQTDGGREYITGWVKDSSSYCQPLVKIANELTVDIGIAWVSDEGGYDDNKITR